VSAGSKKAMIETSNVLGYICLMKDYRRALTHFQTVDPILYQAGKQFAPEIMLDFYRPDNYFERLCRSIVGQQLSTKAAATIWDRFQNLLSDSVVTPSQVVGLTHDQMRSAGLSNAKAKYVHGLATAVIHKQIDLEKLDAMTNEEVISELTQLKGIGFWTAEMFLMFTLGREDLFSTGDLGLKRAIEKLYGLTDPSVEELQSLAEKWSPYRTYACRILWQSLDNNPNS
jgi:DNA-3-methyladenine glycosylase II